MKLATAGRQHGVKEVGTPKDIHYYATHASPTYPKLRQGFRMHFLPKSRTLAGLQVLRVQNTSTSLQKGPEETQDENKPSVKGRAIPREQTPENEREATLTRDHGVTAGGWSCSPPRSQTGFSLPLFF